MRSRIYKIGFVLALGAFSAHAALTETAPVTSSRRGTWDKLTTTVKVKVEEWWNYWNGKQEPPEQQAAVPAPQREGEVKTAAKTIGNGVSPDADTVGETATPTATAASANSATADTAVTAATPAPAPVEAKPAAPRVSDENLSLRQQKMFVRDEGSSLRDVRSLRDDVKGHALLKVARPGRKGTTPLARSRAGVPVVNWKKVKVSRHIPRLDIGTEALISKEDFTVGHLSFGLGKPSDLKRLPSPALVPAAEVKRALAFHEGKVYGARGLQANIRTVGKPLSREQVDAVNYALQAPPPAKILPYKPLSDEQLKMVAALILFEKGGHCHMIMGLFHQLAAAPKTRAEALYHLGACADSLQMNQAAFDNLSKLVASEDREFGADALDLLAKDLPIIYERDFYNLLKGVKSFKGLVTEKSQDNVAYRMAKGAYRAGDYKTSVNYANRVNSGSEFYDDARFLSAMDNFALGDKTSALKKLQALSASLESRKVQDKNIRALTAVNLARMYFATKKYDKALESYMQVPKDHPLWVQALIEQGWTQLALEDNAGAIGNMYSLHSPYFKAVYQPESFVVRTIGYLNICQYGDAYKTLTWLEKDYRDFYKRENSYLQSKGQPLAVYNTVRSYIKGKSTENVDGVPYQVWREMARRKDFLNLQTALNDKQDETRRYDGINEKIKSEKAGIRWRAAQAKKRFDQWRSQIAKIRKDKGLMKHLTEWQQNLKRERDLTIGYRFQLAILEQSREGFLSFRSQAQKHLDTETAALTAKAGRTLLTHAKDMQKEMSRVLDNNEFLRYEVFSGSGENIRYQVAGGAVGAPNRIPASIKPAKMMNWNFSGEFWEDEIGSYRSSLQNNCPAAANQQAKVVPDDE